MVTDTAAPAHPRRHPCTNRPQRSAPPASSPCSRSRSPSSRSRSRYPPRAPHRTTCRSARRARRRHKAKSPRSWSSRHPAPSQSRTTPGEAALRDAIHNRDVYGGIAFGPEGRSLLIATGGSPMVAQMLTQIGNGIGHRAGGAGPATSEAVPLNTEDLAPPTADDPRGAGLAASALPITLAGLLPAIALVFVLKREVWTRFTAVVAFAGLAGVVDRRTAAVCARVDRCELLGRRRRLDAGRAGRRTVRCSVSARCSAGSAWRWER